ncbi:MAG: hypothetical protein IPK13_06640 [Deltaproteobacteria bacterium]|nr:hypothetical protein [Deltaproteobacteria bacterium]
MFDPSTLAALLDRSPLGLYVVDLDRFDTNFSDFLSAFRRFYEKTHIAYSYKTNYLPALCLRVRQLGGLAEVVSRFEYDLARRMGVPGADIIFNGPIKTASDYWEASSTGAIVNIDSAYEIDLLEELVVRPGRTGPFRVGLRCALKADGEVAATTRFGFDVESGDFWRAVDRLKRLSGVVLEGLHCHMIPPGRSPAQYASIARRLVELSRDIWGRGHEDGPGFLDVGGGFFSHMGPELRAQFATNLPTFGEYGEAIAAPFRECFGHNGNVRLIVEPGLALVADAMQFVCRVVDTKRVGTQSRALVGASVYNVRPTKSPRNLVLRRIVNSAVAESPALSAVAPSSASAASLTGLTPSVGGASSALCESGRAITGPTDVVGYTCMEDDVLHRGFEGELRRGHILVFENVGAYTLVLKPPFIQGNVPVFAYRKSWCEPRCVRRAETLDDFMTTYDFAPVDEER